MQWPSTPVPMELPMEVPMEAPESAVELQVSKTPAMFVAQDGMTHDALLREDNLLRTLAPMDRGQLYDLAELLLSELIPGWDDVDDDDDDQDFDDGAEDEDWVDDEHVPDDVPKHDMDFVVDASYRACIREAERFLVQHEGFDAQGSVVAGMREHLHTARVQAATAANTVTAQPRHRAPGYP